MKALLSQTGALLIITLMCLCSTLDVNAIAKEDIIILMEGKLGKKGLRSTEPETFARIQNIEGEITITFFTDEEEVVIAVTGRDWGLIHFEYLQNPQTEHVSLRYSKGFNDIQIITREDTYHATVYVD